MSDEQIVAELERQIARLKEQWPAHSVSPALMEQLDRLEEQLEKAKAAVQGKGTNTPD